MYLLRKPKRKKSISIVFLFSFLDTTEKKFRYLRVSHNGNEIQIIKLIKWFKNNYKLVIEKISKVNL